MILSILNLPTNRPDPKRDGSLGVFEQLLADIVEAHSPFQEQPLTSAVCEKLYVCLLPFYLCRATIDLTLISYGFCRVGWHVLGHTAATPTQLEMVQGSFKRLQFF